MIAKDPAAGWLRSFAIMKNPPDENPPDENPPDENPPEENPPEENPGDGATGIDHAVGLFRLDAARRIMRAWTSGDPRRRSSRSPTC
jgi:hypothetical protein